MKSNKVKAISDKLSKYDYLAKPDDFIQVTAWINGEGYTIDINDTSISLTAGQIDAIDYLTKTLEYDEEQK